MSKVLTKIKNLSFKKRVVIAAATLAVAVFLVLLIARLFTPERSVASYCSIYKAENAQLAHAKGDTYSVTVFSHSSSNPADFANAFGKLEQVAPDDIQPDVKTLERIFQKINDDPAQAFNASLSGLSSESRVRDWTTGHCGAN